MFNLFLSFYSLSLSPFYVSNSLFPVFLTSSTAFFSIPSFFYLVPFTWIHSENTHQTMVPFSRLSQTAVRSQQTVTAPVLILGAAPITIVTCNQSLPSDDHVWWCDGTNRCARAVQTTGPAASSIFVCCDDAMAPSRCSSPPTPGLLVTPRLWLPLCALKADYGLIFIFCDESTFQDLLLTWCNQWAQSVTYII